MAQSLYVAPSTVRTHVKSIYRKLGVSSRGAAVEEAHARGSSNLPRKSPRGNGPVGEDEPSCCALRSENFMESGGMQTMHKGTVYRIVVRSELSERYAVAFEGMEMEAKYGDTVLTGRIIDQPHLHGILERINGLGLELLSVQALPNDVHPGSESKREQEESEI